MSVTLADARPAQGRHLASNFLLSAAELAAAAAAASPPPSLAAASLARLAELNPLAEARAAPLRALDMADEELCAFRCAVLCDLAPAEALALAERLHALRVPAFVLESFGLTAFLFADLGARHAFAVQRSQEGAGGVRAVVTEARELAFPSLRAALRGSWAALKPATTAPAVYAWAALHLAAAAAAAAEEEGRRGAGGGAPASAAAEGAAAAAAAARHCAAHGLSAEAFPGAAEGACAQLAAARGHALAPVCAVVGGLLGQEVVKLVSARDEPVHNLLCFDSAGLGAVTCAVGCA
jgi:ubiquitin-like 1-activating enzyme E1 A